MTDPANPPLVAPNFPAPMEGFVVTTLLIVHDVARSRAYYEKVFDAVMVRDGEPAMLRIANSWLIINRRRGPTDDKPTVTAEPPQTSDILTIALNLRVADVHASYELWRSRGAVFHTEPKEHTGETCCYIRDPDGHLIEVGQMTGKAERLMTSAQSQRSIPPHRAIKERWSAQPADHATSWQRVGDAQSVDARCATQSRFTTDQIRGSTSARQRYSKILRCPPGRDLSPDDRQGSRGGRRNASCNGTVKRHDDRTACSRAL